VTDGDGGGDDDDDDDDLIYLQTRLKHYCVWLLPLVCFLLGNSLASEFCIPTFRNALSVPSS